MHIGGGQSPIHQIRQQSDAPVKQIRQKGADHVKGQEEYQSHDADKGRDGGVFSGEDPVNAPAPGMLPAFVRLDHRGGAYLLNKPEAHIRNGGGTIQPPFLFHLHYDMLQSVLLILVQLQLLQHISIAPCQLGGGKPKRNSRVRRMILDQTHDPVDTPMHGTAAAVGIAEILSAGALLVLGNVERMVDQLVNALILGGRNGHHRHPQCLLHFIDEDGTAILPHLVHHIQRHHHGNIQLQQLHGQVQIPLNVGSVHNIDDAPGFFLENELPCDDLLAAVGRHGINAGQVRDPGIGMADDLPILPIHRHAGKIAHMLIGAGQPVKQGGLAAVLVSHQGKGQHLFLRQGAFSCLGVILAPLSQARVGNIPQAPLGYSGCRGSGDLLHEDLLRIRQPQGQLIPMYPQLQRISHGRKLDQCHLRIRDQTHIQKVLPQGAFSPNRPDHGGFSNC
ncbi:putative uncharacterized protein [Ruminococcus sp. CAG:379]|nr:putative uncharacterized protein [Ruminococcus sp. CAG:379]